jgi:hypothetical protein
VQRDKLIASVRRNSRLAYLKSQEQLASASASAQAAYATLTDKLIDSWSESQLKEFADKNGIPGAYIGGPRVDANTSDLSHSPSRNQAE